MTTVRIHGASVLAPPMVRVHRVQVAGTVVTYPKARVYAVGMTGSTLPKVRVHKASLAGTVRIDPKARVYKVAIAGTVAVLLNPLDPATLEPETLYEITASLRDGSPADSWTWRRVSGTPVTLVPNGAKVSFRAPSVMPPGGVTVLGVRATVGAVTSAETTVTITVPPQTEWSRRPGGQWVGATR